MRTDALVLASISLSLAVLAAALAVWSIWRASGERLRRDQDARNAYYDAARHLLRVAITITEGSRDRAHRSGA